MNYEIGERGHYRVVYSISSGNVACSFIYLSINIAREQCQGF